MKRFYLGLCLIASLILGTACTENLEEGGTISTTNEESPYVVSKDLACQIASSLSQRGSSVLRSAAQDFQGKTVATALSVADDYSEPVMHVINYEGGGFVIIAGDNRMDPILAYSETGSFPSVDEWDLPYGLTLWMHAQEDLASFYRENNMEQDPAAKYAWDKLMGIETVSTKAVDPVEPCEEGDFEMIADVGPFLETEWDQESHFNDLLPMMTCNGVTKHYYAGCVPIAIAQIARFYEYPTTYQWSSMSDTSGQSAETQRLIKDIFYALKGDNVISPDCDGTGVNHSYRKDNFFKNEFGYKGGSQGDYDYQLARDLLKGENPVMVCGDGHAWILDGCTQGRSCIGEGRWAGYLNFHVNWGWGGSYDGWFGFNNMIGQGKEYNPDQYVYVYP